jgi:tetratricopeptide (TPR) repeat protein
MRLAGSKLYAALCLLLATTMAGAADRTTMDLLSLGRMNEAISVLTARDDAESLHLLSRAYFATERWDDAVRSGEKAVALRPDDANYHLWLGREYGEKAAVANPMMAANLARKAKNEFERAVQLDPTNVQARVDLAQYYTEAPAIMGGGLDKAREQAARVAQYNSAESHLVSARIAEKDKQYAEAESQLKQAIQQAKSPANYWMELADFYRNRGRLDDMQSAVQSALAQANAPAETYFDAAGALYLGGRDFPGAVQYLQKYLASGGLVEDAPAFRAHYLLGEIYQKMGRNSAAVAEYQASLSLASGFDRARKALSHVQ